MKNQREEDKNSKNPEYLIIIPQWSVDDMPEKIALHFNLLKHTSH